MVRPRRLSLEDGVLFLLVSVLWGGGFVAISFGLGLFPPVLYAALRYDIAAIVVGGYAVIATDDWRPTTLHDWFAIATSGLFIVAIDNTLLFLGQQTVTSAVASVVVALTPILAAVFARGLLPDEPITGATVGALVLGILGVGALAAPSRSGLLDSDLAGVLLILGATASVALGSVLIRRLESGLTPIGLTAWSSVVGAVLLHLTSLTVFGESFGDVTWTGGAVVALAYLGLLSSGAGPFIYFTLLERVGAIRSNFVSYAVPVFAAALGWLLLGERLALPTVLGFCCILVGFVLVVRDDRQLPADG